MNGDPEVLGAADEQPIVLFDIDGVILSADGIPLPGAGTLVDTLMCLGFEVRFWSAGGTLHAGSAINRAGIYGSFTIHEKPTYPPTESEALRIVGRRPALQIDDDHTERVADWPFMEWGAKWGPLADTARDSRPVGEGRLDAGAVKAVVEDSIFRAYARGHADGVGCGIESAGLGFVECEHVGRLQAGPAAVRPATDPRWFRDNEDDPERHCYRTEDGDEIVVYASREQAERMIAALSGAAVRPVEREGATDG